VRAENRSVRSMEYKTRVIRCSLRAGQRLITAVRPRFPSDPLATIGTSWVQDVMNHAQARLSSEHQMTIGIRHELDSAARAEEPDHANDALEEIRQKISASDNDLNETRERRDLVLKAARRFPGALRTFRSGSVAPAT
jgi:hypothetical protein